MVSRRGDNTVVEELVEHLSRGVEAQGCSRTVVEPVRNLVQVGLMAGDDGALGQLLPDQPDSEFVRPALPW